MHSPYTKYEIEFFGHKIHKTRRGQGRWKVQGSTLDNGPRSMWRDFWCNLQTPVLTHAQHESLRIAIPSSHKYIVFPLLRVFIVNVAELSRSAEERSFTSINCIKTLSSGNRLLQSKEWFCRWIQTSKKIKSFLIHFLRRLTWTVLSCRPLRFGLCNIFNHLIYHSNYNDKQELAALKDPHVVDLPEYEQLNLFWVYV